MQILSPAATNRYDKVDSYKDNALRGISPPVSAGKSHRDTCAVKKNHQRSASQSHQRLTFCADSVATVKDDRVANQITDRCDFDTSGSM